MYSKHAIDKLSHSQISRLLNGHGVRVRHGGHHHIALSHEQSKKHHKATMHGKGYTLHLDPYQIQNHQHLRGGKVGTDLGKNLAVNTGRLADAGTNYLIGQMGGKVGTNLGKNLAVNTGRLADAGTDYLIGQMGGKVGIRGGKLSNKLKHAQQVMDFMGHNYQGIAHAVKPVAKPIFGALTNKAVNAINPVQQLDSLGNSIKHLFGGAVRKRGRPRKVKAGGALRQSGSTGGSMNYSGILY